MSRTELWEMFVKYSKENNRFPSVSEFAAYSRIAEPTMSKVLKMWVSENKLAKMGNRYVFVDKTIQDFIQPEIKSVKPKKPAMKKEPEKLNILFSFVKCLVAVIGIILILCSIHFTFNFNKLGMNTFWAFMLSISIVLFMGFAFTIKSYIQSKSTKLGIIILWVLGISYSVFTAVSGQFNEFRQYSASDNHYQLENQKKIFESQLKTLEKKQNELLHWREQETEYSLNPDLKLENPGTWKTIQNGTKQLNETERKIEEIQEKLLVNIDNNTVTEETVYNWLSSFLNVRADIIQFIIILFPALFIDLCSTICLTFSFGKNEK